MRQYTKDDYDRAFEMWPTNLRRSALNTHVDPYWLNDGTDNFWWRQDTVDGHRFVLTLADTGTVEPLFDHRALAAALTAIVGREYDADSLPVAITECDTRTGRLGFSMAGQQYQTTRAATTINQLPPAQSPPGILAPDGKRALFVKDHNLWCRTVGADDGWPLTHDGMRHNSYGCLPDHDRLAVIRSRTTFTLPPIGCHWSPDGRQVLAFKCDEREVATYPFVESVPWNGATRPFVHSVKMPFAGDANRPVFSYHLLSDDGSEAVEITVNDGRDGLEPYLVECGICHWTADGQTVLLLAATPDRKRAAILAVDRQSGDARVVYEELETTFFDFNAFDYHQPNVRFLSDDRRAIWYSQRDGIGHLYLIDLTTGQSLRQITSGNRPVFDLLSIDEATGQILFAAGHMDRTENPYHRHLYRVDLLGEEPDQGLVQLTRPGFDHGISGAPLHLMATLTGNLHKSCLSPSGSYFVDNQSTVAFSTETYLLRTDGAGGPQIGRADISALEALGWTAPTTFSLPLDDNAEAIHGLIILPRGFARDRPLRMVERIYAGPQVVAQPRSFDESLNGNFVYGSHCLAEFGFAVVIMDTPGTPYRSKPWHDAGYGTRDRLNVGIHARVLQALSARHDWLDASRCGVSGHSWGGHASAMAMLLEPDTYSVGVSSAGIYDPQVFLLDASEKALGSPVYTEGGSVRAASTDRASNYALMSPSTYAGELRGHLLLAAGELDENAPPA